MLTASLFSYSIVCLGSLLVGVLASSWSKVIVGGVRRVAMLGTWVAGVLLGLLVIQQLLSLSTIALGIGQSLWPSPLTWIIETATPAPTRSAGGVHPAWWQEELRFISALIIFFPLLAVGLQDKLLSVNLTRGKRAVVQIFGGLFLAVPMGFVLWNTGKPAAVRAIVSPMRDLTDLPPLDLWVWQSNVNAVGWGHIWAFKALVPAFGLLLIILGAVHLMDGAARFRVGRREEVE